MRKNICITILPALLLCGCNGTSTNHPDRYLYTDDPFLQDYSIKYYSSIPGTELKKVVCDRNGYIQILSSAGLLKPDRGMFLKPGTLVKDNHYKPLAALKISAVGTYNNQIVYCDEKNIFSNALAGKLCIEHGMPDIKFLASGENFKFLVSNGKSMAIADSSGILIRYEFNDDEIIDVKYSDKTKKFYLLGKSSIMSFSPDREDPELFFTGTEFTCFEITNRHIIAGTREGFLKININTGKQEGEINKKMPCTSIRVVCEIDGNLWFGSLKGAMRLRENGKWDYYSSERWLPSDTVAAITKGPGNSVLVLTTGGLSSIFVEEMTLHDKAIFFEKQVRERHIRHGFNATLSLARKGDPGSGSLEDSDNDGLWTGLYLASQAFRYSVTRSAEALLNVKESLEAMERLYTINPVPGFPARSFERSGYAVHDPDRWRPSEDNGWDWKTTTSSDEAIGHIFAFGVTAELIDVPSLRKKSIELIDTLMSHIIKNNFYLIDWDGKPTRWGRWNPEYVNALHPSVGDRKLNSSNIIAMLQTAYHFTGKEKYRDAAFYLINEHGYLSNLIRPMREIGQAPPDAGELSLMLSDEWNHSDDEMYYCGYWGLYRYAFNDTLKEKFRESIIDHWQAERPEKEGLWNIMTYITGKSDCDLEEALWYLREYPLDLITWTVKNSHRKDIEYLPANFRNQTITEVLAPGELPIARHNANRFILDGGNGGMSEMSAGDIWLLPYWMARYLGVIGGPMNTDKKQLKSFNQKRYEPAFNH